MPYIPYLPYIPYFPNMPYQTDHTHHTYPTYHTTPPPHHRGEGEDLIWGQYMGPIPRGGGEGGWQGLVHCAPRNDIFVWYPYGFESLNTLKKIRLSKAGWFMIGEIPTKKVSAEERYVNLKAHRCMICPAVGPVICK